MKLEKIRELRKAAGMTQEDLAKSIGVKRAVISKYENGTVIPPISKIEKIAAALKVNIFAIVDFELATNILENHINEIDETSAFTDFLFNIGYKVFINPKWIESENKKGIYEWIIENRSTEQKYYISTDTLNELMKNILAYTKFQIHELILRLEELPNNKT
ncbi:MAG: helix-turn-helix domain-containing protein [Acutalibacteraceae bacterium]